MPSLQLSQVFYPVGATLVVAHACGRPCRFPDGLVRVGTGRRKGVGRHLARRKRSRAGFEMGDRAPFGRDRVGEWATARVAPTRASSPSCSGRRSDAIAPVGRAVAHAGFPMASFGSVRDAARVWDATSYEGTKPCWIRDGRPQGSPLYHFHRLRAARRGAGRTAGSDRVAPRAPSTYLGLVPRRFRHGGCPVKSLRRERQYRDR